MVGHRGDEHADDERTRRTAERRLAREKIEAAASAELAAANPVRLRSEGALSPPGGGWRRVGASVTWGGLLAVVWCDGGFANEELRKEDGSMLRWERRTGEPCDLVIDMYGSGSLQRRVQIDASTARYPLVDVLPGGRLLIVDRRCSPDEDGLLPGNAVVYGADGAELWSFHLGDGVASVQCTPSGRIWAGYFDEGVFGNERWREVVGQQPPSSAGLAKFDDRGRLLWMLKDQTLTGGIADIYALNVDGETAWACPYVDFPVVRIDAGVVTAWPTDVMGAAALLVDGDVVALVGGYGPCRHERVVVGTLHAGAFARVATRRLEMADGSAPPHNAVTIGRGRRLFLLTDTGYSAVSVEDILT